MADLSTLLSQLEAEKNNGSIDNDLYNYIKKQYYAADKQYNSELSKNYNEYSNTDPLTSDRAKSILNQYQAKGYNAINGAIADSSGNGSIDSFAVANGLRQQQDFTNQAMDKILMQNETRQDRIMQYLNQMKGNSEGYFSKTDKMKTDDTLYKANIGERIANVYSQINTNQQAERNRQAQLQLQKEAAAQQAANLKLQSKLEREAAAQNLRLQAQLQAEAEERQRKYVASSNSPSVWGPGMGKVTSPVKGQELIDWAIQLNNAPIKSNVNYEKVKQFMSSVYTPREFSSHKSTKSAQGYDTYDEYIKGKLREWYDKDQLNDSEVAHLLYQHNIK